MNVCPCTIYRDFGFMERQNELTFCDITYEPLQEFVQLLHARDRSIFLMDAVQFVCIFDVNKKK